MRTRDGEAATPSLVRRAILVVTPTIILSGAIAVFVWVRSAEPSVVFSEMRERCEVLGNFVDEVDFTRRLRDIRARKPEEVPPGYEPVWVEPWDAGIVWTFLRQKHDDAGRGVRGQGAYRPDHSLDATTTPFPEPTLEDPEWTRWVVVPGRAWLEHAAHPERLVCDLSDDRRVDETRLFPPVRPRSWQVARRVGERTVQGEVMVEYERPPKDGDVRPQRFALDSRQQVRWAERHAVHDPGGPVMHHLFEMTPAPDHPPIQDPSDQPVIGHTEVPTAEWREPHGPGFPPRLLER
jgi:hypothetical protein